MQAQRLSIPTTAAAIAVWTPPLWTTLPTIVILKQADRIAYEKKVSSEAAKMNLARWSELQFVFNEECKALLAAAKKEVETYPDGPAARVEMITRT